jgi:putative membrane protein
MTIVPLIRSEFARLTASKMGRIALIALMTVPIIYGGLYLYGNKDPYSNLDNVPAALVVADTGAAVTNTDGTTSTVNYGRDAAASLLKAKKFGWVEVSASAAAAGIEKGTYDFGVTFPASFSKNLSSASGDSPTAAKLVLTTNDANSYLSTTIAKQAAEAVRVELAKQVGVKASSTLLTDIGSIRDGLVKAGDGAKQLADGAATASTGAASVASGSASVASGAASLSSGLTQLNAKASTLPSSTAALSSGASQTASGAAQTLAGAIQARDGISAALTGDPRQAAIVDQLNRVIAGISQVDTGASQVATGAAQLNKAAPALAGAVRSAASGASTLSSGATTLSSGAATLATGNASLATGTTSLNDSLQTATAKVPVTTTQQKDMIAKAIASPLAVQNTAVTKAENYGAGLAPFFLSLAAWIGMYALFLLVRPLSRRALSAVRRPIRTTIAGWLTPAVLGIIQMVGLFLIVTLGLHLTVADGAGMLGFMALTTITYAAIILALNVLLGSTGQFLGLLLMVIQLVVAGGTFPWQTLPAPLRALHEALPMSHAVDGLRTLMYGGSQSVLAPVLILLAWLVGALAVSVLGANKQGRFRTLRELRPSPIGG